MKLDKVSGELIAKMGLMTNIMKQSAGDGMEFQIMLQAMLKNMGEVEEKQASGKIMTTSVGQELEKLDLIIKNKQNYTDTKWNEDLKVQETNKVDKNEKPSETKKKIYAAVDKYSKAYGVDKNFILAVIKAESNFDPKVVSHAGAVGVMQLMPETAKYVGVTDRYDIDQNIKGGVKYLSEQLKKFGGSKEMALMAYNAGPGAVQKRGAKTPSDLYKMPKETQNYVPKVMKFYRELGGN